VTTPVTSTVRAELRRAAYRRAPRNVIAGTAIICVAAAVVVIAKQTPLGGVGYVAELWRGVGMYTGLASAVVGATLIGADFASGEVVTTMLCQPDRRRLMLVKSMVAGATAALTALAMVVVASGVYLVTTRFTAVGVSPTDGRLGGVLVGVLAAAFLIGAAAAGCTYVFRSSLTFPLVFLSLYLFGDRVLSLATPKLLDVLPVTNVMAVSTAGGAYASTGLGVSAPVPTAVVWCGISLVAGFLAFRRWEPS